MDIRHEAVAVLYSIRCNVNRTGLYLAWAPSGLTLAPTLSESFVVLERKIAPQLRGKVSGLEVTKKVRFRGANAR